MRGNSHAIWGNDPTSLVSPEALRDDIRSVIDFALGVLPGETVGEKITALARRVGVKPRRIEDYRWGREIQPNAAEYMNMLGVAERLNLLHGRREALRLRLEGHRNEHIGSSSSAAGSASHAFRANDERVGKVGAVGALDRAEGVGSAARELMAYAGRLEQHELIGLDQADPRHVQLYEVWRDSRGELTSGFIALLDQLGLAELASVYTPEIKIQKIGTGTLFWTEQQRRDVVGKSVFEVPAAASFTRAVYEKLAETVAICRPTNTLLTLDAGVRRATWKRMAFPFVSCVIGSPALQVAV